MALRVADAFPDGEGGVCAPIDGRILLGAGTADRLVPDISGDSCQDGAGPPDATSLTFVEDAADHDRMTLVGRIAA